MQTQAPEKKAPQPLNVRDYPTTLPFNIDLKNIHGKTFIPPGELKKVREKLAEIKAQTTKIYSRQDLGGTRYRYLHHQDGSSNGKVYAIYDGLAHETPEDKEKESYQCILGQGGFGTVKWLCDETERYSIGKFILYDTTKIRTRLEAQPDITTDLNQYLKSKSEKSLELCTEFAKPKVEFEHLSKQGRAKFCFFRHSPKKNFAQEVMVIDHSESMDLMKFTNSIGLADTQKFRITLNMIKALRALHQQGLVHRDISLENFIIHPVTLDVDLIDFDDVRKPGTYNDRECGKTFYKAPEAFEGEFSEKSDLLALAKCIAGIWQFTNDIFVLKPLPQNPKKHLKLIYDLMVRALSDDPRERPPLQEIEQSVEIYFADYSKTAPNWTFVVSIDDLLLLINQQPNPTEKLIQNALIMQLRATQYCFEIWVVENKTRTEVEYEAIRRVLFQNKILVRKIVSQPDSDISSITTQLTHQMKDVQCRYVKAQPIVNAPVYLGLRR